jgi:hypothetical protein
MLHRNNKMVWTGVNGHNLNTECNDHLRCGCEQKTGLPKIACAGQIIVMDIEKKRKM